MRPDAANVSHGRSGFTLIEVMVALALSALVVLMAHRMFTGVADGAMRLTEARRVLDRQANARRWLAAAFGSLDAGQADGSFLGHSNQVEFASWQLTPAGWFSRRRITLSLSGARLLAFMPPADTVVLSDSVSDLQLDYLLDVDGEGQSDSTPGAPGERARFVREWISPVSAPIAIRLRISRAERVDTVFVIVGPRG
jgi:prepilin-type N-terminal cleavage/methylation domain-containing protein